MESKEGHKDWEGIQRWLPSVMFYVLERKGFKYERKYEETGCGTWNFVILFDSAFQIVSGERPFSFLVYHGPICSLAVLWSFCSPCPRLPLST